MLKVVGASMFKTRISSTLLSIFGLLAIGSLFIADMERPKFNGIYCATAYWSSKAGFRVEFWGQRNDLESIAKGSARTCYRDSIAENGWAQIEVETQASYPDKIQAIAAGILEGALTWNNIYQQWSNTIHTQCEKDEESQQFCEWLRSTISENFENIKEMSELKGKHDHYWYQVRLFYYQLEGIEFGWRMGVKRSRSGLEIPFEDFLLLNAGVDIRDLKIYYKNYVNKQSKISFDTHRAIMMLKIFENKIFFGHSADGNFADQLRVIKKYRLNYHFFESHKSNIVPGSNIEFTGYPGVIASQDDFYMISGRLSKLTVGGVKMQNNNTNAWKNLDLRQTVLMSPRVMAANRLAHNGKTWSRILSRDPSTGSKQWLVIDMQNLRESATIVKEAATEAVNEKDFQTEIVPHESTETEASGDEFDDLQSIPQVLTIENLYKDTNEGLLWLVDQIPGRLHAEDVTAELLKNSFWIANGKPYFKEIRELSNMKAEVDENDILIEKLKENITSLDELGRLFKIRGSSRNQNSTTITGDKSSNIDLKLLSLSNTGEFEFYAVSGPIVQEEVPASNVTVARLRSAGSPTTIVHNETQLNPFVTQKIVENGGMKFKKVYHKWAWN